MPPRKTQTNSVIKELLRKHGAETESNQRRSTTPVANESFPNTSLENGSEPTIQQQTSRRIISLTSPIRVHNIKE